MLFDDWLTRAGSDIAERSNSATPIGHSGGLRPVPLDQIVEFYRERGLPAQLLIPERIGAPALRAIEGRPEWSLGPEIVVMTRSLSDLDELPEPEPTELSEFEFLIDPRPDADWLAMYHFRGQPLPPEALAELADEIEGTLGFGRLTHQGETVAVTRGTITESDDGRVWLGYSAVEVAPAFRRRGLGTQLGAEMLAWGQSHGATDAYLQVLASNDAGIGLYTKLGFVEHHRHRYARCDLG